MSFLKRLISVLMLLAFCSMSFGGCQDPDDSNNKSSEDTTESNLNGEPEVDSPREFELIEPADGRKVKIACIGDSITYGTGISNTA